MASYRVDAEALHVAVVGRDAARAEEVDQHVHGLRGLRHEVEDPGRLLLVRDRVGLEGVDHVGELDGVPDEEDPQVVADEVPVAVLGVELHREPARVPRRLGRVPPPDHRREPHGHIGPLPRLLEELGPRVPADRLVAPLPVRLEVPEGRHPTRVHHPLRDPLPVEVADLLEELVVLQRGGPPGPHRPLIPVVVDGMALPVGQVGAVLVGGLGHGCGSLIARCWPREGSPEHRPPRRALPRFPRPPRREYPDVVTGEGPSFLSLAVVTCSPNRADPGLACPVA